LDGWGHFDKHAMHVLFAAHNVRMLRFLMRLVSDGSMTEDLVTEVFTDVRRRAGQ
jgi:RNA polymerase sigma-70 factor, ECF subfamily